MENKAKTAKRNIILHGHECNYTCKPHQDNFSNNTLCATHNNTKINF